MRIINADVMANMRERGRDRVFIAAEHIQTCFDRCAQSETPAWWDWANKKHFRFPPLPHYYRRPEKGRCRICWQDAGKWTWHSECGTAYQFFTNPSADLVAWTHDFLCPGCGDAIGYARRYLYGAEWSSWDYVTHRDVEVDHILPLYRVRREHATLPWAELLRFWSPLNLQALCRECHVKKCASEAAERAAFRLHGNAAAPLLEMMEASA